MKVTKNDLDGVLMSLDIPYELYRCGLMFEDTKKSEDGSLRGFDYYFFRETEYIGDAIVSVASPIVSWHYIIVGVVIYIMW